MTIHAQYVGDKALLSRAELDNLVALARRSESVDVEIAEDDWPAIGIMRLAEKGKAFDFWKDEGENIYSEKDGEPV